MNWEKGNRTECLHNKHKALCWNSIKVERPKPVKVRKLSHHPLNSASLCLNTECLNEWNQQYFLEFSKILGDLWYRSYREGLDMCLPRINSYIVISWYCLISVQSNCALSALILMTMFWHNYISCVVASTHFSCYSLNFQLHFYTCSFTIALMVVKEYCWHMWLRFFPASTLTW